MSRRANEVKYDFYNPGYTMPRLEELSLNDLKTVGKTLGLRVTKYNNRETIISDLYPILNGMQYNERTPSRGKQYARVTDVYLSDSSRYEILSNEGQGAVRGGTPFEGVFHRAGRDGYIGEFVPSTLSVLVLDTLIKKYRLEDGDAVVGRSMYFRSADIAVLVDVITVNGVKPFDTPPPPPEAVTTATRLRLDDGENALLRVADALCQPCYGDAALITHTPKFRSVQMLIDATKRFLADAPRGRAVGLYLLPPKVSYEAIAATGGIVIDGNVPADFAFEAVATACKYALKCARGGEQTILTVSNIEYLAQYGDVAEISRVLSACGEYANGGSLTVVAQLNRAAVTDCQIGYMRGFIDVEFALTEDAKGIVPNFAQIDTARGMNENLVRVRSEATLEGNRAVYDRLLGV